ncbi:MAG: AAA family ATPase [bacterium]|nr:AAA family ATPase [bacterium]
MNRNEKVNSIIKNKLHEGMHENNMHCCLRDTGRLAGGYVASGYINQSDVMVLGDYAKSLSINPMEAEKKWNSAIRYGIKEPITFDFDTKEEYYFVDKGHELAWDDVIGGKIIDTDWLEEKDVPPPPENWNGKNDLIKQLSVLFNDEDYVGYVTDCYFNSESKKYLPKRGSYSRTAGELIELLKKSDDITDVFGDWEETAGAWIRVNPMDGKGVFDKNVIHHKYTLIESDSLSISKQYAIYKELELPIATLIHSAGKSLHALVRIDADCYEEYKQRVNYLYKVCKKNGLKIDSQNRNPSRLSRMAGITRNNKPQYLIDINIGQPSYEDWYEWIEDINDGLPDFTALEEVVENPPKLAPELIRGVLRQGHKLLIAGASKAGKSFDLIQLCIAIAEGKNWHGWKCNQGKVLYVNLELDTASCIHRFINVYDKLQISNRNIGNIDVWNLRGKSKTMDKLAPKLIRRATKKKYTAVIIDPIYKVITGDENSANQMAEFCNHFDKVCTELECAVIYCHHHSKGSQGQKRASDRASGSGVFGRDPDALLDLIELNVTDSIRKQLINQKLCAAIATFLDMHDINWKDKINQEILLVSKDFQQEANSLLPNELIPRLAKALSNVYQETLRMSAWRLEGTLREFASFKPKNYWFNYPIHSDDDGFLTDAKAEGELPPWKKKEYTPDEKKAWREKKEKKKKETLGKNMESRFQALENAYNIQNVGDGVTVKELKDFIPKSDKTIREWIKEHPDFYKEGGKNGKYFMKDTDGTK